MLAKRRHPYIAPIIDDFSRFLKRAWLEGLSDSKKLVLETLDIKAILGEPDGSPEHLNASNEVEE